MTGATGRGAGGRFLRAAVLVAACWGLIFGSPPAAGQPAEPGESGESAELDAAGCADGTYVTDPSANPGLTSDCRTLTAMRNYWLSHPDNADLPADHLLRAWGRGETMNLADWPGVRLGGGRVDQLFFTGAGIGGAVPPEIGQLTGLVNLRVGGNEFTGRMPAQLGELENLVELFMWGADLEGPVPAELGRLENLKWLSIFGNDFTGSIPAELGDMSSLLALSIRDNRLTGSIPPEMGRLSELTLLWLERNSLSGPVPSELGNLTRLDSLRLGSNELTGEIPASLGGLGDLTELWLYDNRLSGEIPASLGGLAGLRSLFLHDNQLTGPIPAGLGGLANLGELDLSKNRLTGPIPPELSDLPRLTALRLSGNRLSGPVPPQLGGLGALEWLYLQDNRLTGPVPEEVAGLGVTEMRLEGNLLTGPVPAAPPGVCRGEFAGRFCDEDGGAHEEAIETVAGRGLILGCEADRFCPDLPVTRRHMAAFLFGAYRWWKDFPEIEVEAAELPDVPEGAWYEESARWAVNNEVMPLTDGNFNPGGTVNRAQAAQMLIAAFEHLQPAPSAEGVFADMNDRDPGQVRAAEGLYEEGVTVGCATEPLSFCPARPLTRAQLATLLFRALPT